jgi:aryl-alcohol dehydrogenase-like predicted oxidoreductase
MLPLRPFGSTGMDVSPLGLGTVKFGRDKGLKHPGAFVIPSDREAADLIALAADLGINLIDTAPAYGSSEERLGALLAGQRERWVICSKVGEEFDNETGLSRFDFSPSHVRASVERSLRRLGTDRIDMVLVHSDGRDLALIADGVLEVLDQLKSEGGIRAFGMSTKTVEGAIACLERADCAMVTYNLADVSESPAIEHAAALGKGILVKKPLASGHLGGAIVEDSFRHILSCPGVGAIITGTIDPHHLRANVQACAAALADIARPSA